MKYEQKGTLAYYDALPQLHRLDMSDVPLRNVVNAYSQKVTDKTFFDNGDQHRHPEIEAIEFYGMSQLVAHVRKSFTKHEPLPEWAVKIMDRYTKAVVEQSTRMFYYLLLICTRETRHGGGWKNGMGNSAAVKSIPSSYLDFKATLNGCGSDTAIQKFLKGAPEDLTLGQYTRSMCLIFYKQKFGSCYGGPKWGAIADTLHNFVTGETSMEIMVDTGYTLAHNGGPIFNKGMLYHSYGGEFIKILDIQRAGMIAELVLDTHNKVVADYTEDIRDMMKEFKAMFPHVIGDYVDYWKVEALGATGNYYKEKAVQKKIHGDPTKPKVAKAKPEDVIGTFWVDHKTKINIIKPNRKAVKQPALQTA